MEDLLVLKIGLLEDRAHQGGERNGFIAPYGLVDEVRVFPLDVASWFCWLLDVFTVLILGEGFTQEKFDMLD